MARLAGKARGDMRAMEEQMERHNPVSGRGATPSMGLSQFRGGAHMEGCGDSESDEEMEGDEMVGGGDLSRMVGSGRKKKGMSEATQMGLHLGKHLHSLHGAGFFDDFKKGFMSVVGPVASVAKGVLPMMGPKGQMASAAMGALGLGKPRRGRGVLKITHGGATNSDTGAYDGKGRERDDRMMLGMGMMGEDGHGMRQGGGFLSDLGIPVVSQLAGMVGLGREGCGTGAGRKKRAPAGPSDGRRKRAEVVKKVMAEKGMKMIEASKYVKAHGLY